MTEFEPRPPTAAVLPALVASGLALLSLVVAPTGLVFAAPGAMLLLFGARMGERRHVSAGAAVLSLGVLVGAFSGVEPAYALVGGVGAVVAYDAGEHAVSLGHDVGQDARVEQAVLVHVASTVSFSVVVAALAFGVYTFGPSALPLTALLTLLLGGILLAFVLRE